MAHDHHHHHAALAAHPTASLLRLSATTRLGGALGLAAALWGLVAWAMMS
ncbi:hypothetical protein [Alsobacter sp. R-9]